MLNVHSAGHEPYEAAPVLIPLTLTQTIDLYLRTFFDLMKVIILSVWYYLSSINKIICPPPPKDVRGWTALVTGGANGIGKEIAFKLAEAGCNVAIADIDGDAAKSTTKEIRQIYNVTVIPYKIDVADPIQVNKLQVDIERDIGPVDILVNNAGLMPLLSCREGENEDVDRIIAVNFTANVYIARTFINRMIERKQGHIITMSSMSAHHPIAGAIIYSATKFAVTGFTRALEEEIRQEGHGDYIHFTCIHPYFVSTRKDLMESINIRFPAVTVEEAAKPAVEGILRNHRYVSIPPLMNVIANFFNSLPYKVQTLIRDHVCREKEARVYKNPEQHVFSKKYN